MHLANFRIGGTPVDFTPYVPPQYRPYTEPTGGGGAIVLLETDPDPSCGAKVDTPAERAQVYRSEPRYRDCIAPGGRIRHRRVGRARLGMTAATLRKRLGVPRRRRGGSARWCVIGGSTLRVSFRARRPGSGGSRGGAPRGAALIRTDNPGVEVRGVGVGTGKAEAARRLGLSRAVRHGHTRVYAAGAVTRRSELLLGVRKGKVRWLGLADPARVRTGERLRHLLRGGA